MIGFLTSLEWLEVPSSGTQRFPSQTLTILQLDQAQFFSATARPSRRLVLAAEPIGLHQLLTVFSARPRSDAASPLR